MKISLVLPAYNEAVRLVDTVANVTETLKAISPDFEIIIAEDGSTDGTDDVARKLTQQYKYIKHVHSDARQGRGRALTRAFKASTGDVLCYIDVDLATDMSHLKELIEAISIEGYDFATGSRMMPSSNVKRPLKRGIASRGFNFLVRYILGSKLYDHQCGFKAFKRAPLFEIMDDVVDPHWFWDTELFVKAQYYGYSIKEFPVNWQHGGTTKVSLKKDIISMGSQILRLRKELNALESGESAEK
jgi:glycosyltransferase AglD